MSRVLSPRRAAVAASIAFAVTAALATAATGTSAAPQARTRDVSCSLDQGSGPRERQRAFAAASETTGVPADVLLAVSYMESRWDDHAGKPSTAGGYGPMHLTDTSLELNTAGKGDGTRSTPIMSLETAQLAASLTGESVRTLEDNPTANICGGAAVLADFQRDLGGPVGSETDAEQWAGAVARYSSAADEKTANRFVTQVYTVLRDGESRKTTDGQRVALAGDRSVAVPAVQASSSDDQADCPPSLGCLWIPAPYEWYGAPDPRAYGNHDIANRQQDMKIDYIVIHDTEASWDTTLQLVQDPTYVSWQYSVRSSDGQIANHVPADDVAWQAGNWYVNMHSMGIEHEGYAADGAAWYTEAMYQNSATLVRYLTTKYGIARDRAHIIGHDQVPGITPAAVKGMHWDPGPYWDWEHYMALIGAPIGAQVTGKSNVWTVAPGFEDNVQPVTGCESAGVACDRQGTNFVYVRTAPKMSSPLVKDAGLHPDGTNSTTYVSDIGARATAGQQVLVTDRVRDWAKIWWLGAEGWIRDPKRRPVLVAAKSLTVQPKPGLDSVPVYGRAYPEESAYPAEIPYQTVTPLQYTIKAGQAYAVGDADIQTDYYYAKSYDNSVPGDHTQVVGTDRYYQIWFGHRMAYVRAADVALRR